jgi:hypothetical protein
MGSITRFLPDLVGRIYPDEYGVWCWFFPGHPRIGVCSPPQPGIWIVAPLPSHWVQRAERRSMSLEASGRTMHAALADDPQARRNASQVGGGGDRRGGHSAKERTALWPTANLHSKSSSGE